MIPAARSLKTEQRGCQGTNALAGLKSGRHFRTVESQDRERSDQTTDSLAAGPKADDLRAP